MNAGQWLLFIGAVGTGVVIWTLLRARARDANAMAARQRTYLLLLLRSAPADLNDERIESAAREAWLERFGGNADGTPFVDSSLGAQALLLQAHGNAFAVTAAVREQRQLLPPEHFVDGLSATHWDRHSHDLSVGLAYSYDPEPRKLAAYVGKLAAALCDEATLAVYHPGTRRLWTVDEATRARLRTDPAPFFQSELEECCTPG